MEYRPCEEFEICARAKNSRRGSGRQAPATAEQTQRGATTTAPAAGGHAPLRHCNACAECYFWSADFVAGDYTGATSGTGMLGDFLGGFFDALSDSSRVTVARWPISGVVCCDE